MARPVPNMASRTHSRYRHSDTAAIAVSANDKTDAPPRAKCRNTCSADCSSSRAGCRPDRDSPPPRLVRGRGDYYSGSGGRRRRRRACVEVSSSPKLDDGAASSIVDDAVATWRPLLSIPSSASNDWSLSFFLSYARAEVAAPVYYCSSDPTRRHENNRRITTTMRTVISSCGGTDA